MKTLKEYEEEVDKEISSYTTEMTVFQEELLGIAKQKYRQAIKEIVEEVVGKDKIIPKNVEVTPEMWKDIAGAFKVKNQGYNQAKAEIRANAAKVLGE